MAGPRSLALVLDRGATQGSELQMKVDSRPDTGLDPVALCAPEALLAALGVGEPRANLAVGDGSGEHETGEGGGRTPFAEQAVTAP